MRSDAPALMPIFRSRHQADLLAVLLLHPDRDYTLTELADRLEVPLTTLQREVRRLADADLITSRQVGRARLLRANKANRVTAALTALLTVTFGPQVVVGEEFAGLDGVERVLLYGSWAARYHGQAGPPPHDVDVLVVGEVDRAAVYEAADRAERRLGLPVNPTLVAPQRWAAGDDPLVRQIEAAPMATVIAPDPDTSDARGAA